MPAKRKKTQHHGKSSSRKGAKRAKMKKDSSVKAHHSENQKCFLDLPGEIRNRIYSYCLVKRSAALAPQSYNNLHYHGANECYFHHQSSPVYPRHFFSMALACRLTRQEFLPLYHRRVTVQIRLSHAMQYMETFFPQSQNGEPIDDEMIQSYQAKIVLIVEVTVRRKTEVNLLPMIELCMKAPGINIRFDFPSGSPKHRDQPNQIFRRFESLGSYQLANGSPLAEINLRFQPPNFPSCFPLAFNRFFLNICFKEHRRAPWIETFWETYDSDDRDDMFLSFLEQVGLENIWIYRIGVGIGSDV